LHQEETTVKSKIVLVLLAVAINCPSIMADQLSLKNGDRLTGQITKTDGKTLTLKTAYAGEVSVALDAIDQLSSDQPLYLTLGDGQTVIGTVASKDGKFEVTTKETATVKVDRSAVQVIRSKAEQDAYTAEVERYRNPRLVDLWSGSLDLGYSLTTGNSSTTNLAIGANAVRATTRDKTSVYLAAINAKNKPADGESVTTARATRWGARYELNLTKRLSAFVLGDFETNKIQLLDLRAVFGGGLGYYVKKTDRAQFQIFGGGAYNKESFSTGVNRSSAEALVGEDLGLRINDRMTLRQRSQFFPNLSETGEYRLTFDSSVVTKISKWFNWQVTFSDHYISNPVAGSKANDILFTTGVGLSFKQ
jgi:putative salt-induced outer membrane protein YdiY